jgi:hypothetical protein
VAVSGGSNNSNGGKVLTSIEPTSGHWQAIQLSSSLDLRGVSCGSPSLCVAVAREGRIFVSTNPTGGAPAWSEVGAPGGAGDLEGVSCIASLLCAAGNLTGNVLTSTDPTGGADSWHFENLVPFRPTEGTEEQTRNALFGASCASTSLCALVGSDSRIFTSTDPFSTPAADPSARHRHRKARRRPRTILAFAEHFWEVATTRHRHIRARFRFYSPTRTRGFEWKRDRGPYCP